MGVGSVPREPSDVGPAVLTVPLTLGGQMSNFEGGWVSSVAVGTNNSGFGALTV